MQRLPDKGWYWVTACQDTLHFSEKWATTLTLFLQHIIMYFIFSILAQILISLAPGPEFFTGENILSLQDF